MTKGRFFAMAAAIIVAAVSLSSCATVNYVAAEKEYNAAWVGQTHSAIITAYGAPEREVADGNGGSILVYEKKTTVVDNYGNPFGYGWGWGYGWGYGNVQASTSVDYVHFYVNAQGVCYQVKTNMCLPDGQYDRQQRAVASNIRIAAIVLAVAAILFPVRPFLYF